MKRFLLIPFMLLAMVSLAACGGSDDNLLPPEEPEVPVEPTPGEDPEQPTPDGGGGNGRYLVLYCSRTGNTERMAQQIQTSLNCDILVVEPQTPYDTDYNAMLSRAQAELAAIRQGNYPPISTSVESFEQYDTIFVGYPIWHGSMATPMQAFLHAHATKLAGKHLALFSTSGSSSISTSVGEARALCSGATFTETLLLTSSTLSQMSDRVAAWLQQLGANREEENNKEGNNMKINIIVGGSTITATMEDNAAGRDFLSRLPLEVTLNDYNSITEKIFYPSPALTTEGVTRGCTPVPGDITIYAPWGNVAIFCKAWSQSSDLIKIGHIDGNGINALNVAGDVAVKFEKP